LNDTATTEIYTLSLHDALPIAKPPDLVGVRKSIRGRVLLLLCIAVAGSWPSKEDDQAEETQDREHEDAPLRPGGSAAHQRFADRMRRHQVMLDHDPTVSH